MQSIGGATVDLLAWAGEGNPARKAIRYWGTCSISIMEKQDLSLNCQAVVKK